MLRWAEGTRTPGCAVKRRRRRPPTGPRGCVVDECPARKHNRVTPHQVESSRHLKSRESEFSDFNGSFHAFNRPARVESSAGFRPLQEIFPSQHAGALTGLPKWLSLPLRTPKRTRADESERSLTSCLNSVQNVSRARRVKRVFFWFPKVFPSAQVIAAIERSVHRTEI
jgi:hypothetical protein